MEKEIHGRQLGTKSVWLIACLLFGLGTPFIQTAFGQKNPIAAGREHSLVLRSDGQVLSFGDNGIGQLGNATTTSTLTNAADFISGLTNVFGLTSGGLNAEDSHSLVLKSDGTLWGFGRNDDGELGIGATFNYTNRPAQVVNLTNVIGVSAGACHTLALKNDLTVWAFGQNSEGQIGLTNTVVNTNKPVMLAGVSNVVQLSAGGFHSLVIDSGYYLWAFGKNTSGQLGQGANSTNINYPIKVPDLAPLFIVAAAAGGYHSLALENSGSVWAFGTNGDGELGLAATFTSTNRPAKNSYFSNDVVALAAGGFHSLALKFDGTVWAFGRNVEGQLGLASNIASTNRPVRVPGLSNVVAIAAGAYHSLAMTWDGTVWAFGKNSFGQLGNKTVTNQFSPVAVSGFRFIRSLNLPYPTDEPGTPVNLYAANSNATSTVFAESLTNQLRYLPYVVPWGDQKGVGLDKVGGNAITYFPNNPWTNVILQWSPFPSDNFQDIRYFTNQNPLVAFGSKAGGSSLYLGQPYRFQVHIGVRDGNSSPPSFRIYVYRKSDFGRVTNIDISLPKESDAVNYTNFLTQGFTTNAFGLTTFIKPQNGGLQEVMSAYSYFPYLITHTSTNSDYFYEVDGAGLMETPAIGAPFLKYPIASTDSNGTNGTLLRLYLLDFEAKRAWHSVFIDHPQYEVNPLPEAYLGKSLTDST